MGRAYLFTTPPPDLRDSHAAIRDRRLEHTQQEGGDGEAGEGCCGGCGCCYGAPYPRQADQFTFRIVLKGKVWRRTSKEVEKDPVFDREPYQDEGREGLERELRDVEEGSEPAVL